METIATRLWKLPRQFVFALINASAILVIAASILALLAITRINHFAGNIAATMTESVLSKLNLPSREVLANLQGLRADIRAIGNDLREDKFGLSSEIAQLKDRLTKLSASIDRLSNARTILTGEAIGQLGRSIADGLPTLRSCLADSRADSGLALAGRRLALLTTHGGGAWKLWGIRKRD